MNRWQKLFASLVLGVAVVAGSAPAGAQQAPAAPARPAAAQPATPAAAAPQRMVRARDLMTLQERAAFRAEMRRAAPEQRRAIRDRKWAELRQRASSQGMRLVEPGSYAPGMKFQRSAEPTRPAAPPRAP